MNAFLFLHLIPMIAAVGCVRIRPKAGRNSAWGRWIFSCCSYGGYSSIAFAVFPSQYISLNVAQYDRNYNVLYLVESGVLLLVLGIAARGAPAGWKMLYLNLMAASALYALDSVWVNLAVTKKGLLYRKSLRRSASGRGGLDGGDCPVGPPLANRGCTAPRC